MLNKLTGLLKLLAVIETVKNKVFFFLTREVIWFNTIACEASGRVYILFLENEFSVEFLNLGSLRFFFIINLCISTILK